MSLGNGGMMIGKGKSKELGGKPTLMTFGPWNLYN
jgi:hypothetical protein